jgi:hypothetical protein
LPAIISFSWPHDQFSSGEKKGEKRKKKEKRLTSKWKYMYDNIKASVEN